MHQPHQHCSKTIPQPWQQMVTILKKAAYLITTLEQNQICRHTTRPYTNELLNLTHLKSSVKYTLTKNSKSMERAMGLEPTTASLEGWRSSIELRPQNQWWAGEDSNLRRRMPADLQSAPFNHSGTCPQASNTQNRKNNCWLPIKQENHK